MSTRRRWIASAAAGLAAGCAVVDEREPPEALRPAAAPPRPAPGPALLTPWQSLLGGWSAGPGVPQRLNLRLPVGVAALGEWLWVADAGWRQILRLERARDTVTPLAPFAGAGADHMPGLHPQADGSLWLAEAASGRVLLIDPFGRVRRTLADERFAARPVAAVTWPGTDDVFVADQADAQITVFSRFGQVLRRFGQGALQSVAALAPGPQGLYALDRLAQQVVVFSPEGRVLRTLGSETLVQPRTLAVDGDGRVFVGDDADQRVHVFAGQEPPLRYGGFGNAPGRFGRIDALAVAGGQLFVADSANARVQVLLVSTPSLMQRKAAP